MDITLSERFDNAVAELSSTITEINLERDSPVAVKITKITKNIQEIELTVLDLTSPVGESVTIEIGFDDDEEDYENNNASKPQFKFVAELSYENLPEPADDELFESVYEALGELPFIDDSGYGNPKVVFKTNQLDKASVSKLLYRFANTQRLIDSFKLRIEAVISSVIGEIKALS
jgi:hypothetical protein